jgi:hypothetical protein
VALAEPLGDYVRAYHAVSQAENPQAVPGGLAELVRRHREQRNRERLQRQGLGYEATDAPWRIGERP